MNSRRNGRVPGTSSLVALQPIDASPFQRPSNPLFVWGTLAFVWLVSLLPWRVWQPTPDILLLVLAFWCLHEPRRVGLFTAFVLGLLMDVHDSEFLGLHAIGYVLTAYGAILLRRRLEHFSSVVQTLHLLPVFILAAIVVSLLGSWLNGEWVGWDWLWSALMTAILWPLADILLLLPQRRLDDTDVNAA
ncbi:MAG TPA: rod shape-determining protein MreD [Castellaniella sp.]|nr:rod shape-determining protein MreD [Castellaniella sp.]